MKIENDFLSISVKTKGAELGSIFNKQKKQEMLWQGDAAFWGGQAPILFPIVGSLKGGHYFYEGKKYELPRHGLARKSNSWIVEKIHDLKIKGTLEFSEDTLKIYPFPFLLEVFYEIKESQLSISYKVTNKGKVQMPFSIGAHPAFNCFIGKGIAYTDYWLEFETPETASRYFLTADGLFDGTKELVLDNTNLLQLSEELFSNDALVFFGLKSKNITLKRKEESLLKVSYPDFNVVGLWAAPKAPFVCIEPWIGYADQTNSTHNLFEKNGSKILDANEVFEATYTVEIL